MCAATVGTCYGVPAQADRRLPVCAAARNGVPRIVLPWGRRGAVGAAQRPSQGRIASASVTPSRLPLLLPLALPLAPSPSSASDQHRKYPIVPSRAWFAGDRHTTTTASSAAHQAAPETLHGRCCRGMPRGKQEVGLLLILAGLYIGACAAVWAAVFGCPDPRLWVRAQDDRRRSNLSRTRPEISRRRQPGD